MDGRMNGLSVKHIGIVLFPDVEELDVVGPWEALSFWTRSYPQDGYAVSCPSRAGGLVTCAQSLTMRAHHSLATRRRWRYCSTQADRAPGRS